ncbi:hypothetical protein JIQ42_02710 [Leishmania sp. Namibia]|uniref:hypothetical protein n=1 Tax=Leishmania sp. Namibia TaxID=2802991 RepID=UPI001B3E3790|nr:hypothetical protein JIQ42_02710 [Leishmania sp. Namibia]
MEAETLLRLTAVSLASAVPQPTDVKDKKIPAPPTSHTFASESIRAAFINQWSEGLGNLPSVKAFLRDTLVFFLPGHWCCEPCETEHLVLTEGDEADAGLFALSLESHQTHRGTKKWAANPFVEHLKMFLSQLQPRAPHAQSSFQEWLTGMDRILADMRALITLVYSAFLNCFCDVNKILLASYQRVVWEDVQPFYALAVYEICRTIESKLMGVVAHVVSKNVDACNTNTTLQLFYTPVSLTANDAADCVASVVQARLVDVVSSVALTTRFAQSCPKAVASSAATKDNHEEPLALLRGSISAYVEKLLAAGAETRRRVPGVQEPMVVTASKSATPCGSKKASSAASPGEQSTTMSKAVQVSPYTLRAVSIADAFELTTLSEEVDIFSRFAALVAPIGNKEENVQSLVAKQRQDMGVLSRGTPGESAEHENRYCANNTYESTTRDGEGALALSKRVHAVQRPSAGEAEPVASYGSNPRERRLFWNRLQRALDLDEASTAQAMSRCVFPNDSPYPNVFLKDLDVGHDDRATQSFVREIRPLLSIKGSLTMKAASVRLFCEACIDYGRQLWEKTLEIRESLPCLPLRVSGVLLGRMYASMRADKQFESIKQIYMQLCRVTTRTGGTAEDATALASTETLLIKRAEFLAKSAMAAECEEVEGTRSSSQSTEAASASQPGSESTLALRDVVNGTVLFSKVFRDSIGYHTRNSEGTAGLKMRRATSTDATRKRSSVTGEGAQPFKSAAKLPAGDFSPGTPVAEVYRQACRCYGVNPNSSLMHDLSITGADYFAALDLSSNYVGVMGLKPVLDLLQYNGERLVSLSVCNNSLESDDVRDLCCALRGPAGRNLVHLDLSYNPFTNSAFPYLKELVSSLACIETLVMKGTLLFSSALRELKGILEEKTIRRYSK